MTLDVFYTPDAEVEVQKKTEVNNNSMWQLMIALRQC